MHADGFPREGTPAAELLAELRGGRGDDLDWRGGKAFSLVYNVGDDGLEQVLHEVANLYLHENALNPFAFPSLLAMEQGIVAMAADLLGGRADAGALTSGGTESIFLAVQVARDHARTVRGIAEPRVITANTAHPAFAKACHYLDVEMIRLDHGVDGRAVPALYDEAIDERTALLVASAPCYPYGVIDPVIDIAAIAAEQDLLCHVDACLGGWMLPWWERLAQPVPSWDFRVEGVTSLSADIHKYGYVFKGASTITYRDRDLFQHQIFMYDSWPGGLYASSTAAGTRSGAPIAGAWAAINHLGTDGYLRMAARVLDATTRMKAGIEAIDGLAITGEPDMSVFEFGSDVHDMDAVCDQMDDRGWNLDRQQGGLHLMLAPGHDRVVDEFCADLAASVASYGEARGTDHVYGGVVE